MFSNWNSLLLDGEYAISPMGPKKEQLFDYLERTPPLCINAT